MKGLMSVLASSTSDCDEQWSVGVESRKMEGKRSEVHGRTRSEHDLARRVSFSSRRRQSTPSSAERNGSGRQEGTRCRRAASGSPRGRIHIFRERTRALSTRSVNVDHHSTQQNTSSEHLRRVALAVRQLTDIGKCVSLLCHIHNKWLSYNSDLANSAILSGWVTLRLNFRLKGSRQYLWTVR